MLPAKLGMSVIMPVGEARTVSVAFKIAAMRAITDIREHKLSSHTMRREKTLIGITTSSRRDTHTPQ
jgi:hypothetical protein